MNESLRFNIELMMDESRTEREFELEEQAYSVALDRVHDKTKAFGFENTKLGKAKVDSVLNTVAEAIQTWCEEQRGKRNKPKAFKYIESIDANALAYVTSKQCVMQLAKGESYFTNFVVGLGNRVKELVDFDVYNTAEKALYTKLEYQLKYANSRRARLRVLTKPLTELGYEGTDWNNSVLLLIGGQLIDLFNQATGYLDVCNEVVYARFGAGSKVRKTVKASKIAAEWLESTYTKEALLTPFHYPMLVPPEPWSTPYDGGYLNKQLHALTLVNNKGKMVNRNLENQEMPDVYEVLNVLQATPWRINKRIQSVFASLIESESAEAGLPARTPEELPALLWKDGLSDKQITKWKEKHADEFKAWCQVRRGIHQRNKAAQSKILVNEQKLHVADKFLDEEAIYFPYGLDFRGRIYASAGAGSVNPQADDSGKALLEFAVGKEVGEAGGFWLGVHVANTYGNDKVSLEDRVQWAQAHTLEAELYASDPLAYRGWMKADKPFCYLAACMEWSGFMAEGNTFISHVPVAIDGSCSGLQHFGAMLKDTQTCENVNVISKGDTPTDVYSKVKDKVEMFLHAAKDDLADEWLTRLHRSTVKQPTMTTPYGVTAKGRLDQIVVAIDKAIAKGTIEPFSVSSSEAARYLSPLVSTAIGELVHAADEAMNWLTHLADVVSKAEMPIRWTVPTGFGVTQTYKKRIDEVVNLMYDGQRIRLVLKNESVNINRLKAKAACAPNYVHSLDAAHLMSTVVLSEANGIDTFAMIHDSFGTHCSSMDVLAKATRESFVEQYSGSVLTDLYEEVLVQLPAEQQATLNLPPLQGDADLALVRDSEFFFA